MIAKLGSGDSYLRPVSEVKCKLVPVAPEAEENGAALKLYDFLVLADSKTCPHPTLRNRPDGHVTGDLFEEVRPGHYVFRESHLLYIRVWGVGL